MTERLSALLHEEADRLEVPVPPVREALAAGRGARRRRRLLRAGAVAATVTMVVGVGLGTAAVLDDGAGSQDGQVADPAPAGTADVGAVFSVGRTLYLDGGAVTATFDEIVQAMYPTSAGVLVRTNGTGASDGGAPFHFALVSPDGTVHDLGLTLGEVVPSTDPGQPYLAYTSRQGNAVQAVLVDVTTGREAARVDVPGSFTRTGWEAPPVALSGDDLYVATDDGATVVHWRTGDSAPAAAALGPGIPVVAGGHVVVQKGEDQPVSVVDAQSGDTLLDITAGKYPYVTLSPDGRFAKAVDQDKESGFQVYAVDTGTSVPFDGAPWTYGWTSDGDLFSVSPAGVQVCAATTGTCRTTSLPAGVTLGGGLRVMGLTYES
jgi:hypothetical protein